MLSCLQMKCMVEVLGQPEDHMLRAGIHTKYFFIEEVAAHHPTWRLMVEYLCSSLFLLVKSVDVNCFRKILMFIVFL